MNFSVPSVSYLQLSRDNWSFNLYPKPCQPTICCIIKENYIVKHYCTRITGSNCQKVLLLIFHWKQCICLFRDEVCHRKSCSFFLLRVQLRQSLSHCFQHPNNFLYCFYLKQVNILVMTLICHDWITTAYLSWMIDVWIIKSAATCITIIAVSLADPSQCFEDWVPI